MALIEPKTTTPDKTFGVSVGNSIVNDTTLDETKFDKSELGNREEDQTLGIASGSVLDQSTLDETKFPAEMTNTTEPNSEISVNALQVGDVTHGVAIETEDDVTLDETVDPTETKELPKPVVSRDPTVLEISSDDEPTANLSDSEVVCIGDVESSELSGEDDPTGNETEEFDTADETNTVDSVAPETINETELSPATINEKTQKLPTPKFDREMNNGDVESSALPVISEDEDLDMDEESIHEPFGNSTFSGEIKGEIPKQSPSILKRRRSSTDPNDSKRPRRSVSFCDQFKDSSSKRLPARGNITGGLSPSARRLSRSGRMLQMANKGENVSLLNTQVRYFQQTY